MSTLFPSSLDNKVKPTATTLTNGPTDATYGNGHAAEHIFAVDSIQALEAKVGVNSSAVQTTHDYKLQLITGANQAASKAYVDAAIIAGGVDASTTNKGVTKLSVAPVLSTNPIAVGNNDTRVPIQNQTDALAGTSGTAPSSSNKFVDAADVATTATASKVVRTLASGLIDDSLHPTTFNFQMTAGENLTVGNALCAGFYQADGGVTFDANGSQTGTFAGNTGGTSFLNFTVGNHTNRALVVFVHWGISGGGTLTGVSYAGSAMTLVDNVKDAGNVTMSSFILFNPTVGASTVQTTFANVGGIQTYSFNVVVASYYNVYQSAVDSHNATTGAASYALTVVNDGTLAVSGVTGTYSTTNQANNRIQQTGGSFTTSVGDSGLVIPVQNVTITPATSSTASCVVGLRPVTAVSYNIAMKSSAANAANAVNLNKYRGFVGFAGSTVTVGQPLYVQNKGLVNGLSGLTATTGYYLADTAGTISTSAGTNTKKVGFGTSTTSLVIDNNW